METLRCSIHSVRYHNPENGFSILNVIPEGSTFPETMQVKMLEPTPGITISAIGEWTVSKFGTQFVATEWEEEMPVSLIGIEGYLASGLIKGIGPIYAKKIVQTFGTDTFNILDKFPERIKEISGIGTKRCAEIIESWTKQQAVRKLMIFLKKYDISTKNIIKIHRTFGEDAIEVIKNNPYRLADNIDGISFKIADSIALNIGFEMEDPRRVQSGIRYVMTQMCENGDTYSIAEDIIREAYILLEVDSEVVEKNIEELVSSEAVVDCEGKFYLKPYYDAEVYVARRLVSILSYPQLKGTSKITIDEIEKRTGIHYEGEQVTAINTALTKKVMILTGGPGTGKTTVIRGIIELLSSMGLTIACAAPTGKAAKRMSEVTGRQAKTIHRLLDCNPSLGYAHNEYNPLIEDVLVVDEVSMVNLCLMESLIRAIPDSMRVIFVGDIDQLPCIGSGNVLGDCIESGVVPVVELDKIFRQAENSNIIGNAHRIKNGMELVVDNSAESDFFFMKRSDVAMREIVELVTKRLPKKYGYNPIDIQVLTPMKKCEIGVDNINVELQKAINPNGEEVKYGKGIFRVGDKIIQTVNNYEKEVFNGDSGFIDSIDSENKVVYVRFDDRIVDYSYMDLDEISLAYALTIHKSQGSEYPIVVIPITYANKVMMQRNLIYTAITRATRICVIIGSERMVSHAIGNVKSYKRKTLLAERLRMNCS